MTRDMGNCLKCGKPTRSHPIYAGLSFIGHLCHGCYTPENVADVRARASEYIKERLSSMGIAFEVAEPSFIPGPIFKP
jgi:hypothetical protein